MRDNYMHEENNVALATIDLLNEANGIFRCLERK